MYPDLEFETKVVEICKKLSKIYYSEVEHSNFTRQTLAIFEWSIFLVYAKHSHDLHNTCYALINRARGPYDEIFVLTFKAYGPHAVRSMRLECQNKYFPYGPKSRLI